MRALTLALARGLVLGGAIGLSAIATPGAGAQAPASAAPGVRSSHVQGNVWLVHAGIVNVAVQIGDDGVLVVDTGTEGLAEQILTEIRRLAGGRTIRYIINTSADPEHTGGNVTSHEPGARSSPVTSSARPARGRPTPRRSSRTKTRFGG